MKRFGTWLRIIGVKIPLPGFLTLAAFVICAVSGVALALVYRPDAPFDSLALLTMKNPAGLCVRSVHYWSAQLFLVGAFFHIGDHLIKRGEASIAYGVWFRLALTIPVILYAMLSGFLLRADAESQQAMQVMRSLLHLVPLIGDSLASFLTGSGTGLFVPYLHHIATATFIIWLTTIEHSRRIMPTPQAVVWVLPPVLLLAILLVPGLGGGTGLVEKGPWYLVGLQEILHWLPQPGVVVWFALVGLAAFALLPKFAPRVSLLTKRAILVCAVVYAVCTVVGLYFRGEGWRLGVTAGNPMGEAVFRSVKSYLPPEATLLKTSVPMVAGKREGCLSCHQAMTGFSPAHDPKAIGCAVCHLGDRFTLNKELAHTGMTLTPGNLSVVQQTCATANCHGDIQTRVRSSLMNTMSGVVAVDKCVFGESDDLDRHFDVARLGHSPADTHLRQLCASCHLGQNKIEPAPITEATRGGGCSACHLNYDAASLDELYNKSKRPGQIPTPLHHPAVSVGVPAQACFGCHSRSGRISTNYEGWHETLLDEAAAKKSPGWPKHFRLLDDGRVFEKRVEDVHHQKGMECIDCHIATEVMGDGLQYDHQKNAVKIACLDCHTDHAPSTATFAQMDLETQKIAALRNLNEPGRRFVLGRSGRVVYPNVFLDAEGRVVLKRKNAGNILQPKPLVSACRRDDAAHQKMECRTCHSAWVPQCVSCHTSYDRATQGWDHLAGKDVAGAWRETPGEFFAEPPVLGVELITTANGSSQERIGTFAPGMILSLDKSIGSVKPAESFHRLYAPVAPHTTVTQARGCRSCHENPLAIGYGRGKLTYEVSGDRGEWRFQPSFPRSAQDGLPEDAWIAFLQEPKTNAATRTDARPFNLLEQRNLLLVGACLHCHSEKEPRIAVVFADFKNYRSKLSPRCALPAWASR